MRIAAAALALWAAAVAADEEPDVPALGSGTCEKIVESPLPDDDDFFNFYQVPLH